MQVRLRQLRKSRHMTQLRLCQLTNIPQSTISKIERGTQIPSGDLIEIFSNFFGVTADYFLGLSEYRQPPDIAAITNGNTRKYYHLILDYASLSLADQAAVYEQIRQCLHNTSETIT